MVLCRFGRTICLSSSCCGIFLCVANSNNKSYSNKYKQQIQIMIVNILQNWSHRYYNHYSAIKCVDFEPIHNTINMDALVMCFYC